MNRKILMSFGAIVFITALSLGATGAFFSDDETSTGNTFTAGAIDLKVDSTAHYNNAVCVNGLWQLEQGAEPMVDQYPVIGSACGGSWELTDLGPQNVFFNFGDIKPGDKGENTVSLHIINNPAWACAYIHTTENAENSTTTPEVIAGDSALLNGSFDGELAQNLHFFTWLDNASTSGAVVGDNIWQAGEQILSPVTALSSLLNATTTLPLADSVTNGGQPLSPLQTHYIGVAWCAGTLDTSVPGSWTCNGASVSNVAQTDSAKADITFHVEQARNNSDFTCVPPAPTPTPTPTPIES
ncbi:MAG: SipW-dependent-type signal peptide-containing protein [Minisyncoccia bacterium]